MTATYGPLILSVSTVAVIISGPYPEAQAPWSPYGAMGHQRRLWLSTFLPARPPEAAIEAGNVGTGTTSPGKTLSVSDTAEIVSRTMVGGTGSATLQVSGSLLLAGSDSTSCDDTHLGILRRNPTTGRLQVCK